MMDGHPIKTSDDHEQALLRIDALMNAEPGTEDGAELDVLVTLVEAFENEHFPIESPKF
jgi:HTH-type transcriptional regulator/antitoxin HigA